MSRYVTRARPLSRVRADWYDDDSPFIPALEVEGPKEVDTGLVSAKGEPIFRVQPPIGFGRNEEW